MRLKLLAAAVLFAPMAAFAQAPASPPPARGPDTPITRAQFIQRAADQAARRFDEIDVNHTGTITRAQMRSWAEANHGHRPPPPQQ